MTAPAPPTCAGCAGCGGPDCAERPVAPAPAPSAEPIRTGNPAYDAVYAYIRALGDYMPPDPAHRNALIWRAVQLALAALRPELDELAEARADLDALRTLTPDARRLAAGILGAEPHRPGTAT